MSALTVGSLFSGIGGLDLGLERAGMRTIWFCEIDPFCQKVLRKHWPGVSIYDDVRTIGADSLVRPDVLAGGFPCQDVSTAGPKTGLDGGRSGLWREFARLIGELRPAYILVENVPNLLNRGVGRVLGDLAEVGYDAEWDCIPAGLVGSPQFRERLFVVAYPTGRGFARVLQPGDSIYGSAGPYRGQWANQSRVGRVAYGVPGRVDRIRALGNAVVPQVAEWIGRRIMEADTA